MSSTNYTRRPAMGTLFEAFLAGDDDEHLEAVAAVALDEVVRLDGLLSRFDPRSEVARLNRDAARCPVRVDYELWNVLRLCEEGRRRTGGFFDVTATTGAGALLLDDTSRTVRLARPGARVDLGGVGKGYALDAAAAVVRRFGVTSALLHGGTSSVLAVGRHPEGAPWPVDLRDPFTADATPVARLALADRALSCSAALGPGQAASDTVDPPTGAALGEQVACVVLTASAADAEILSTALLAMGKERAAAYLDSYGGAGLSVGWIDRDGDGPRLTWLTEAP